MNEENRKIYLSLIFGAFVIVASGIYFLWGIFFTQGSVLIEGQAPFSVEVFGGQSFQCDSSPCEISARAGNQTLIFRKSEHNDLVKNLDFNRVGTETFQIIFDALPQISAAKSLPEDSEAKEYEIIFDEARRMQKLVESTDPRRRALLYFPKSLESPEIFGNRDYLFITDQNLHLKANLKLSSIQELKIPSFPQIRTGKWSLDGRYFVFESPDQNNLQLLDSQTEELRNLNFASPLEVTDWTIQGLAFATKQANRTEVISGSYQNYITLQNQQTPAVSFAFYHPDEDTYSLIGTFSEVQELPDQLAVTANGKNIYFQTGENFFQIF